MTGFLRLLVAVLLLQLLSSCGLYDVVTLAPPESLGPEGATDTFRFQATASNDEAEFKGFELYYKFYSNGQTPPDILYSQSELVNLGFKRVAKEGETYTDLDRPLIFVPAADRGVVFDIYVVFDPVASGQDPYIDIPANLSLPVAVYPEVPVYPADEPIVLLRGIRDNRSGFLSIDFKPFLEYHYDSLNPQDPVLSDPDINESILSDLNAGTAILVLYVFSYGVDEMNGYSPVYSVGVPLGQITIGY